MSCLLKVFSVAIWIALIPTLSFGGVVEGHAEILSGETLKVGSVVFRLAGIDAPEKGQVCTNKSGKEFDCGRIAATALMDLTAGAHVRCLSLSDKGTLPMLAQCDAAGYDLAEGMVYTGWALPDLATGSRLAHHRDQAEKRKHGLWAGQFQMPWKWREERSQ